MRRATATRARTVRTPAQQPAYREGSLGWYLIRHGWKFVYIGQLAHPYWRRANGPSMPASTAWAITLREMGAKSQISKYDESQIRKDGEQCKS